MLADITHLLRCPTCATPVGVDASVVRCSSGHAFDLARQGYVNFGGGSAGTADTAAMVADRADFLANGHYLPLLTAVARTAAAEAPAVVVDAGAGTGAYLAATLEAVHGAVGIALDISVAAVRRAARAHPRMGAVVADVWAGLPVADGVADVVLNVFAPRNGSEFARVLRPGGAVICVTPTPEHLAEIVEPLGLLTVDPRKDERVQTAFKGAFVHEAQVRIRYEMTLGRDDLRRLVGMGPSAHHADRATSERLAAFGDETTVTVSASIGTFRRAD